MNRTSHIKKEVDETMQSFCGEISQLYQAHSKELTSYLCKKFYLNASEAEDFVQVTFTKLTHLNEGERLGSIDNPRAYLYRMANNLVIDHIRSKDRHENWVAGETLAAQESDGTIHDPARIHSAGEELTLMRKAIESMPEKRRNFLKLSRYDNLSNVEIAKIAGISEAAVRKHIAKALVDIKRAIDHAASEVE